MKPELNHILLIDDNEVDNLIHKMTINKSLASVKVTDVTGGQAGIDYLISAKDGNHSQPDLIFLDINMPGMDGWEFLEVYQQLDKTMQQQIVIIMLTTSLNPDDKEKAGTITEVKGFIPKPLTEEALQDIIATHFQ